MRQKQRVFSLFLLSPSSRRAWIEMQDSGVCKPDPPPRLMLTRNP